MNKTTDMDNEGIDRRDFFRAAGAGLTAATVLLNPAERALAQFRTDKDRLDRIASCTWPIRSIFKSRPGGGRGGGAGGTAAAPAGTAPGGAAPAAAPVAPRSPSNGGWTTEQMKAKYGEITMLDFPQFTKDTFPGVTRMDLFSGLFGDVTDDSMYQPARQRFDPIESLRKEMARAAGQRLVKTGTKFSTFRTTPRPIWPRPGRDAAERRRGDGQALAGGLRDARREVDAHELDVGARPRHPPERHSARGPAMAIHATSTSSRCSRPRSSRTRRWPTSAATWASGSRSRTTGGSPPIRMNIRIILDEVNHPDCEASPDFCNWEHEYMLFHGLKALAPYAHTNVHAKYWDRWGDKNDVQRSRASCSRAGSRARSRWSTRRDR